MKANFHTSSWSVTAPLAGIAAAFLLLGFLPQQRAISELREELKTKQEVIAKAEQVSAATAVAVAEFERTSAYNEAWRGRGWTWSAAALFGEIAQLADRSGTSTTQFEPGTVVEYEQIRLIPLGLHCEGSFAQVRTLLEGLEASGQRLWIRDLMLKSAREDGETVKCELGLAIFASDSENSD